jgi:hypothetical protein
VSVVPPPAAEPQPDDPGQRQYLRSIAICLPRSVHQHLHTQAATRSTTATALILQALNNTHAQLPDALAKTQPDKAGGDLFDIPQARRTGEPVVETTIRVTDRQHQTLTHLATTHKTNRSRLISTALGLYLG